jgi:hypothetical protein
MKDGMKHINPKQDEDWKSWSSVLKCILAEVNLYSMGCQSCFGQAMDWIERQAIVRKKLVTCELPERHSK